MFKIDSPGATIDNQWTEGNPSLGVPATVVSADFMNLAVQNELVELVEFSGQTLSKVDDEQLRKAVQALIAQGGGGQLSQAVVNLQAAALDVTGLLIDKLLHTGMSVNYNIERQTATQNVIENGILRVTFDPVADDFRIDFQSSHDDAGVTFEVTAAGQVQYKSDDLTGATYVGLMRFTQIVKLDI